LTLQTVFGKGLKQPSRRGNVTLPRRGQTGARHFLSRERICAEIAGCVTPSFSAAREKLLSRQTC